jgi:hypothetical protein
MLANFRAAWRARSQQGFAGVLPFDWNGSVVVALVAIVGSFFLFGYWYAYWRRADMDFMMVYQGFLLNDGRPQDFFDHPGHLNVLLTDAWFRLLHSIGALKVVALSDIPPAADAAGFAEVWTAAVRAGRLLSLVIVVSFVGTFAVLLRRLIGDWRITALATIILAFSSAVTWQARIIRTDMLAAGLELIGLLLLVLAARAPGRTWRALLVGLAAMLCTLGVINNVKAIFLAAALPVVVALFGLRSDKARSLWRSPRQAAVPIFGLAVLVVVLASPVWNLVETGLSARATSVFNLPPPPLGVLGLYQAALAAWVAGWVLVFAAVWRVPPLETLATLLAVALGVGIGLLALDLRYHPQNVIAVINPIEHMFVWATFSDPQLATAGGIFSLRLWSSIALGFLDVLARLTFVFHTSTRATIFLEWVVLVGLFFAWRQGRRLLVLQVASLVALAWGIDTVGTLRDLQLQYAIYTDPLIVLAAAWLFAHLPEATSHRHAFTVAVVLVAVHVVFSQIEPIRHGLARRGPEGTCSWLPRHLKLIERFPYCPPPA